MYKHYDYMVHEARSEKVTEEQSCESPEGFETRSSAGREVHYFRDTRVSSCTSKCARTKPIHFSFLSQEMET